MFAADKTPDIPGADAVVQWFGYWPTFHDAEVLSVSLHRRQPSQLLLHVWARSNETDASGHHILQKHAFVTFTFLDFPLDAEGITRFQLEWFNHQNVLSSVLVEPILEGYTLHLDGIFGLTGVLSVRHLSVSIQPAPASLLK